MYVMTSKDRQLLEDYKALGTPDEIRARLSNPYPQEDEGYAPMPYDVMGELKRVMNIRPEEPVSDHEKVREMLKVYPAKPDSGLLTDDGEDANYAVNDGLAWQR